MTKQLVVVTLMLALAGGGWAESAVHTRTVDITTPPTGSAVFNYGTGEFTITGGEGLVTVKMVQGTGTATMTALKVTGKLAQGQVAGLVAYGPVHVETTTPPDAQGNGGSQVTASADNRAEYSETTQKVLLYGNAQADYVSLPEGPEAMRAHFTGETIEADLISKSLTVTKAHIAAQEPLKPPAGAAAPAPKR
jgi:hypothetical protein